MMSEHGWQGWGAGGWGWGLGECLGRRKAGDAVRRVQGSVPHDARWGVCAMQGWCKAGK
jgi:hypothetical protein